jgi:hypothetical protein
MILWVYGKEMLFFIYMQIFTDGIATKKIVRHFFADFKTGLNFAPAKANGGIAQPVRAHDS